MCSNWACTESVRGEVSDGLPYLDLKSPGGAAGMKTGKCLPSGQKLFPVPAICPLFCDMFECLCHEKEYPRGNVRI